MQNYSKFLIDHLWLIAIAVISGALLVFDTLRQQTKKGVTPQMATHLINQQPGVVIDLRAPTEFSTGHLPNAKNISASEVTAKLASLNKYKDKPVILIGSADAKSVKMTQQVLQQFKQAAFTRTYFLEGGIEAWKTAGLPTVSR